MRAKEIKQMYDIKDADLAIYEWLNRGDVITEPGGQKFMRMPLWFTPKANAKTRELDINVVLPENLPLTCKRAEILYLKQDIVKLLAEYVYQKSNSNSKMDIPSIVYEDAEKWLKEKTDNYD